MDPFDGTTSPARAGKAAAGKKWPAYVKFIAAAVLVATFLAGGVLIWQLADDGDKAPKQVAASDTGASASGNSGTPGAPSTTGSVAPPPLAANSPAGASTPGSAPAPGSAGTPAPAPEDAAVPPAAATQTAAAHSLPLAHSLDLAAMKRTSGHAYDQILGDTFLFLEAQRSGALSAMPGGNRIAWRGDQLLDDGSDVSLDLSGGYYEAGNRLKVTLPTAYMTSRLAWSCLLQKETYAQLAYGGRSMLHWCEREVAWGARWLLKTHVYSGSARPSTWSAGDKFVVQVGVTPADFSCYRRAERMPDGATCPAAGRATVLADDANGAAEVAGEAAAALAAAAALLQGGADAPLAADALATAKALFAYAQMQPQRAAEWSTQVHNTYPATASAPHRLWAAAMLAWVSRCDEAALVTCDAAASADYLAAAELLWAETKALQRHEYVVSNWDNPTYDAALLLATLDGGAASDYRAVLDAFVTAYVRADGTGKITASPKGLRRYEGESWASLRLATFSAFTALTYATLPAVPAARATAARCLARSQLGYAAGDTGFSYIVGYDASGEGRFPQQVHHRDAACTLAEDAAGFCAQRGDGQFAFRENRDNPHVLTGAIVGGPDATDAFKDVRGEYHYTEVALDYNTGLTSALAAMAAVPPAFWEEDCAAHVLNYPWP